MTRSNQIRENYEGIGLGHDHVQTFAGNVDFMQGPEFVQPFPPEQTWRYPSGRATPCFGTCRTTWCTVWRLTVLLSRPNELELSDPGRYGCEQTYQVIKLFATRLICTSDVDFICKLGTCWINVGDSSQLAGLQFGQIVCSRPDQNSGQPRVRAALSSSQGVFGFQQDATPCSLTLQAGQPRSPGFDPQPHIL